MINRTLKILGILITIALIPFLILLVFFIYLSWGSEDSETLFVQKIKGSDLLIVDYDVWYGRDGNTSGKTISRTTTDFNFRKIEELPISYIKNISNQRIEGVSFISSNEKNRKDILKNKTLTIDNIIVNATFYKTYSSSGPCMLNEFKFESFKETNDSLFLYGLDKVFGDELMDYEKIGFKKGNIKILSDSIGNVIRLEVEELILINKINDPQDSGKTDEYATIDNLQSACLKTYYMKPTSLINEKEFSDYGIFKKLK